MLVSPQSQGHLQGHIALVRFDDKIKLESRKLGFLQALGAEGTLMGLAILDTFDENKITKSRELILV